MTARLERRLADVQRSDRVPGLSAAVGAAGAIAWTGGAGLADVAEERPVSPGDQFRIGSISKLVTAICVLQLRDEGRLDLDDPLSAHIAESTQRGPTVRRMLSHLSGLQREPVGDIWATMEMPSLDDLVRRLSEAEMVLPGGDGWHYSNLAYGLLGEIVRRLGGEPYPDAIRRRVLDPLGMTRTTWQAAAPTARGYMVAPYDDSVQDEPAIFAEGFGPAGQLWSTPSDLCRLGCFLAKPSGDVLSERTVTEMHRVQSMVDDDWTLGFGLGPMLHRAPGGRSAGHDGAMPGFLASLCYDRPRGIVVSVTSNSGSRNDPTEVAFGMLDDARSELTEAEPAWTPAAAPPAELAGVPGRWWSEGEEFVFCWSDGALRARSADAPRDRPPAVFRPDGEDRYRVESGRERGEPLVLLRDPAGAVAELRWAGYPFTRQPRTFDGRTL